MTPSPRPPSAATRASPLRLALRLTLCLAAAIEFAGLAPGPAVAAGKPPLKVVKQQLVEWMVARKHVSPDTLARFTTSAQRMTTFRALVKALAQQNWTQVATLSGKISYDVVALQEAGTWFAMAYDRGGRDPTVIVNLSPRRELIVGAPHVPFEVGTGEQAMILLRDVGARAAIVSGAHRCASRAFTRCDGETDVCGQLEGYRDSDVAHNHKTMFHAAHEVLADLWPNTIILSLHGMSNDTDGVRTSAIISNGIRADDDDSETAATKLRNLVGRAIKPPGSIVSCNLSADASFAFRLLCGNNNVQGRYVNGDADVCRTSVNSGTGRFIHIEQDRDVRDPYIEAWQNIQKDQYNNALVSGLSKVTPRVP